MAWTIEFSEGAKKTLSKLDKQVAKRILSFFKDRLAKLDDPRSLGQALQGSTLGDFWKYRFGDWRAICSISDEKIVITVLKIGHRSEVYKEK